MKILPIALLSSLLGVASGFAGSFGPPPFSNGSPLQSGIDGTYQASVYGTNLSGVIRFAYQGGTQTGIPNQNSWVIIVSGSIYRGNVESTMAFEKITGILDSDSIEFPTDSDGTVQTPIIFVVRGLRAAGEFDARIDYKNPNGEFSGTGRIQGTPGETVGFITVSDNVLADATSISVGSGVPISSIIVTMTNLDLPQGDLATTYFKLRGIRSSTTAGGGTSSTTTSTGTSQ